MKNSSNDTFQCCFIIQSNHFDKQICYITISVLLSKLIMNYTLKFTLHYIKQRLIFWEQNKNSKICPCFETLGFSQYQSKIFRWCSMMKGLQNVRTFRVYHNSCNIPTLYNCFNIQLCSVKIYRSSLETLSSYAKMSLRIRKFILSTKDKTRVPLPWKIAHDGLWLVYEFILIMTGTEKRKTMQFYLNILK